MRFLFILSLVSLVLFWAGPSRSCETCAIVYLGKKEKQSEHKKHFLSAKVLYENQDWEEIPASTAHQLHDQGHHIHDKQDEQIVHTILMAQLNDRVSVEVNIPYVTKHFIEIESHAHLGKNQTSNGLGDITVIGDFNLLQEPEKLFGLLAGIKTPSGKTDERTSFGSLIEPELQPGSGSVDYIAGLRGSLHPGTADFSAGAVYIYRTEGEQAFRFGNVLSVSLYAGRNFDLKEKLKLKAGVMVNNQLEQKQNNANGDVKDSGGYTMLIGPQVGLAYDRVSLDVAFFAPAVQHLGGVHQELDTGIFTGSLSIEF